ncbi:MAG: molybdopterin molybdotransferase MoeA [Nocardioides sp.]|nr:molybdopterin molybdotransferase MoeA [Nocardioides sp.]
MTDAHADRPAAQQPSTVDEHLQRVLDAIKTLPDVPQPIMECLGLACAEDVFSPISLPSFDNSAMDGYAVQHAAVADASEDNPVVLSVVGEIGAGQADLRVLPPGAAAKIMTGAPVPQGCDAVVPYEWTDRGAEQVTITRAPQPGAHIRRAGEDVAEGDLLIEDGTVLGPRHLGLLASVGRHLVRSRPRPRVVIISTGTELREPGSELGHDSIFDGNSYLLAAAVRRVGGIAYRVGIVPDDPGAFGEALQDQLVRADLVVTSGGVSQGDFDVVKEALTPQGVWFGPVAMQPGKPQGFGLVGEDRIPIFTLPGNPVSAYVSFQVFVLPAIRKMMGMTPLSRPTVTARLTHAIASTEGRQHYVRGEVALDDRGPYVGPVGGTGSHLIGDLASSNCLIVVPRETTALKPGDQASVLMLDEDY